MSMYRKTSRAIFWGVAILLTLVTGVALDRLGMFWNLWAQLVATLVVIVAALALSRLVPRWLKINDDR